MNADVIRTSDYKLKALRAYALGCCAGRGGSFSSRIFRGPLRPVPACAAMDDVDPRVHLLADGQRKYQRGGAQFHSQPLLSLKIAESALWNHAIDRVLFFSDDVRRRPHAAPQGEFGSTG